VGFFRHFPLFYYFYTLAGVSTPFSTPFLTPRDPFLDPFSTPRISRTPFFGDPPGFRTYRTPDLVFFALKPRLLVFWGFCLVSGPVTFGGFGLPHFFTQFLDPFLGPPPFLTLFDSRTLQNPPPNFTQPPETHPPLPLYIYIYKERKRERERAERERQGLVIFGGGPFWGFRPRALCFLVLSVGSARSQLFMPGLHHAHTLQHT